MSLEESVREALAKYDRTPNHVKSALACIVHIRAALDAQTKPEKYVCPACKNRGEFLKGPEGGLSINIQCVKCGNRWNDMPGQPLEWIGHRDTAKLAEQVQTAQLCPVCGETWERHHSGGEHPSQPVSDSTSGWAAQPCHDIACPDERQYGEVHHAAQHCNGCHGGACLGPHCPSCSSYVEGKGNCPGLPQPPSPDVAWWLRERADQCIADAKEINVRAALALAESVAAVLHSAASAWEERTRGGGTR